MAQLGIFLDLRNPSSWERPWETFYQRNLDLVVEAERLGAGSVWLTEHHLFDDGYLPQPLVFAAAIGAVTTSIRIGTAVLLAPLRHPAHIAEEAAVADLVSGGRLELGLGAGFAPAEDVLFGRSPSGRFAATDAAFSEMRRLLDQGVVTPRPLQHPFPLWLGYQGPRNAQRAGRLGAGLLSLDREVYQSYLTGLLEGGHDPATARLAGVVDIVVADDPEQAWERIAPFYLHQMNSYHASGGLPEIGREDLGDRRGSNRAPLAVRVEVLSVDEAVALLESRTADLPVAHVYTWASIAGMPDDLVHRHLELLLGPVRAGL